MRCFDPCNRILKLWESQSTPKSPFWECESHIHTLPKVRLRQRKLGIKALKKRTKSTKSKIKEHREQKQRAPKAKAPRARVRRTKSENEKH